MPVSRIQRPSFAFLTALTFLLAWLPLIARACEGEIACVLEDRSYHLRVPDNWDGTTPLPVLLHFHGWGRSGAGVLRNRRIATLDVADDVLLLAPNGRNNSWSFRQSGSADVAFARAVINDAAQRYPIDRSKIIISGYSWGANMAWRFVCESGNEIAGLLAVSGTLDQNENCTTKPAEVRQIYGLTDNVLDFPIGPGGDKTYPVALWRRMFGCSADQTGTAEGPWNARPFLTIERTSWDCPDGDVILDLHPSGHFIPHDWIALQVRALLNESIL